MLPIAQRSVEDELAREVAADIPLIAGGYFVMFLYMSISLGKFDLVRSKVLLGFFGVLLVVISIAAALGLTAAAGVLFSAITTQVLPFLMLGIGVVCAMLASLALLLAAAVCAPVTHACVSPGQHVHHHQRF